MTERELVIMGAVVFDPEYAQALQGLDAVYLEVNKVVSMIRKGVLDGVVYDPSTAIDYLLAHKILASDISNWQYAYSRAQIGSNNLPMVMKYINELNAEKKKERILSEINSILSAGTPTGDAMQEVAELAKSSIDATPRDADYSARSAINEYLEWQSEESTGLHIGIPYIDRLTDYINYGEVVTYLGRPGTGKTFLMMKTVFECLKSEATGDIAFFTLEMNKATFIERMMQMYFLEGRYSLKKKREEGMINIDAFDKAMRRLQVIPERIGVSEIASILRRKKIKVAFIDFLQMVDEDFGNTFYEKTTHVVREIKGMAKNERVAVFLASQISRKGEGGETEVTMDMARSSGEIEELSDFMIGIWNPSLNKQKGEIFKNQRMVKLIKNKRGPLGGALLHMDPDTGIMHEMQVEE